MVWAFRGAWRTGLIAAVGWAVAAVCTAAPGDAAELRMQGASTHAQIVAQWALGERDAQGKPFAIVDKKAARIFVFDSVGRLVGTAPVLLGLAVGDDSAPGVGQRVASGIAPDERTTPAGRFASEPGHNNQGDAIVWVDYTAAVAIHRLRPAPAHERRPQRLASETPADNRISLGCIVVAAAFYDDVVGPTLGRQRGLVYVLPDTRTLGEVFGRPAAADL